MRDYENGIHNISNVDYHASSAVSRSSLMLMLKSPLHFMRKDLVEFKESKAMRIGSMVHTLVLEPDLFESEYIVKPDLLPLPKVGLLKELGRFVFDEQKEAREDAKAYNHDITKAFEEKIKHGLVTVDFAEMKTAQTMSQSITLGSEPSKLLKGLDAEKSIFWHDEITGLAFKCRPDAWKDGLVIDLKTTKDASKRKFTYSCLDYGYFMQAAMIREGLRAIGQELERYIIICIENTAPFAPAIHVLDEQSLDWGYNQFRYCADRLSECMKTGNWPSYKTEMLSVPENLLRNDDE